MDLPRCQKNEDAFDYCVCATMCTRNSKVTAAVNWKKTSGSLKIFKIPLFFSFSQYSDLIHDDETVVIDSDDEETQVAIGLQRSMDDMHDGDTLNQYVHYFQLYLSKTFSHSTVDNLLICGSFLCYKAH